LLTAEPQTPHLVADDFAVLLRVQVLLFDALPAHATQPDLPLMVGRIQGMGATMIVLTARGQEFRPATEYQLQRNGYDFADHAVELAARDPATPPAAVLTFAPYRKETLAESGLSPEEAAQWRLPDDPKEVSYGNGIYMVAGQHKGAMLAVLLKRANRSFKAVVFIDQDRQVRRVCDALLRREYDVTGFEYQREDNRVKRFQYADKTAVSRDWRRFKQALEPAPRAVARPLEAAESNGKAGR
jgi:hypothetical protein